MTNHMDYLKEKLEQAQSDVLRYARKIKEEERRTQKFEVRIIALTRREGKCIWEEKNLCEHVLTLSERDSLIGNLWWLKDVGK
jgi:hypothetical protein